MARSDYEPEKEIIRGNRKDGLDVKDRWWTEKDPAPHVMAVANAIYTAASWRRERALNYARHYCGSNLQSLYQAGLLGGPQGDNTGANWNSIRCCVDTGASKISKNKPRVLFLTSGGSRKQQKRAKKLTQFVDGIFYEADVYETTARAFIDAEVWGTGFALPYVEDGEIKIERVLPFEILVDDSEAIHGSPRSMYRRKPVYRDVLMDLYGKGESAARAIHAASGATGAGPDSITPGLAGSSEMVPVIEAWHLPSSRDAKNGRHCICIEGALLFDEPWTKQWFPPTPYHWQEPLVGYWGQGMAEQLRGGQIQINYMLQTIHSALNLMAVPRVFLEVGSKVVKTVVSNQIGSMVNYVGHPPIISVGQAMGAEVYSHLKDLWAKQFEIVGVSQMDATAKKPEGLDAAVAIREYHDLGSERFVKAAQRFEDFHLELAEKMLGMVADMGGLRVRSPDSKFVETLDWKSIGYKRDEFVMHRYPTSILPDTPAGRMQTVSELLKSQLITPEQASRLLDFPDLQSEITLTNAAEDCVHRILDAIVDDGEYEAPEESLDLAQAAKLVHGVILQAKNDGVEPRHIELLYRWQDDVQALADKSKSPPPGAAPAPAPGGPPPGPAAAPPPGAPPGAPALPPPPAPGMSAVPSQLPVAP